MNFYQKTYPNTYYFYFFLLFWAIIFFIEYIYRGGIPFFLCNDSFQYLSIARNIYLDIKNIGAVNYALDIYYDEIALFGYDLSNIKPYHFPSFSIFLSLFYHIFNNDNFVIYASQYIAFIVFSFSSFLILNQYLNKNKSLILTILSVTSTPIILYISDSGKEILFSGLSLLTIYLGMFYKNNKSLKIQLSLSIIFSFMVITRSFYLVLAFLIFCYNFFPLKYSDNISYFKSRKQTIFYFIFIFLIPLCAYIFCYYFLSLHLFIYDNRTDIYGGKSLNDLSIRIFYNLFVAPLYSVIQYLQFLTTDNFTINISSHSLFHLYFLWGLSLITLGIYFLEQLKNIFAKRSFKITRLLIIKIFFSLIIISVIVRFSLNGYRLTIGLIPIIYYYLYQRFFYQKSLIQKSSLIFLLIINTIFLVSFIKNSKQTANYFDELNQNIKNTITLYGAKRIALNFDYTPDFHLSPIYYLHPQQTYFYTNLRKKNLCDDLSNYHQHHLDFDMIFLGYGSHNISDNSQNNCDYILKNFILVDINKYGLVYANKAIYVFPYL